MPAASMLVPKRANYVAPMLASAAILLILLSGYFELPSITSSFSAPLTPIADAAERRRFDTALDSVGSRKRHAFTSVLAAFGAWDAAVGCPSVRAKIGAANATTASAMAAITGGAGWAGATCEDMKTRHVGVFVKGWTWIPDALDGVYTCRCGVSCVWSKAAAVVDRPDAMLFEGATPPLEVLHFVPSAVKRMQTDIQCGCSEAE
jgi:alpha-1,4-fucosyltransferase